MDIPPPQKKWLVGILSLFLTFAVGAGSHFFAVESQNMLATTTVVPAIACGESKLIGCQEGSAVGDTNIEDTFLIAEAVPYWIEWLILFAAGVAVLMITIGGGAFLFAGANEELASRGKRIIVYSFVGLFVSMFAFFIVKVIENLKIGT